ncbi:hypothetical protein D3C75_925860 [compost metagenome]
MLRIRQLRRIRKLVEADQMFIQPLAVRLLGSDGGLNLFVGNDPAFLRIHQQHAAWSQTVFIEYVLRRDIKHACFRG